MTCEYVVTRAAANLPQTTTETLFAVSGGKVLLLGIIGEVTTAIQAQNDSAALYIGANDNVIPFNANLNGAAAGSLLGSTAGGASPIDAYAVYPVLQQPVVAQDGCAVSFQCSASNTGQIAWTLWYKPLDPGAKVTAA